MMEVFAARTEGWRPLDEGIPRSFRTYLSLPAFLRSVNHHTSIAGPKHSATPSGIVKKPYSLSIRVGSLS